MTIYTSPDQFEDRTPSAGQRFGTALGTGFGEGLKILAKNKFKALEKQQKAKDQQQKHMESASSAVSKFAKESGRDYTDSEEFDRVLANTKELINKGISPNAAAQKAWQWNEHPDNPINIKQEKPGFFSSLFSPVLDRKGESAGEQETAGDFMNFIKEYSPDKALMSAGTHALEFAKDTALPWIKTSHKFQETEESKALEERAAAKTKTATSVDDFSKGELASLKREDIDKIKDEKLRDEVSKASNSMSGLRTLSMLSSLTPLAGGEIEERTRKMIDPDLPAPPPLYSLGRTAGELYLMYLTGGGSLAAQSAKLGALAGGGRLAGEIVRTAGTDKPMDKQAIGTDTAIGIALPVIGKFVNSLGKPVVKDINKIAKIKGIKPGTILKEAEEAGVSIPKLQKGNIAEKSKFGKFLEKEAEEVGISTKNIKKGLDPERVKPIDFLAKKEAETIKKARSLKIARAETVEEATTRFSKESQELSKSSFDKYLEKKPETKAIATRREALEPKRIANQEELIRLKAKRKYLVEASARKENQAAIDLAVKEKYGIGFEAKYGHKPTMSSIMTKVEKAEENLVNDIINPTTKSQKSLQKFNKTTNTFVDRAESEMVYGKNRKELPDKFVEDYFQTVNEKYLNMYEKLETKVQKEVLDPNSLISKSGKGDEILKQLKSKIGSSKTRLDVQMRKRQSLEAIKGPKGVFHRKWIDDIKREQKLFNKDMLRISNKITSAEREVTPAALKRMSKVKAQTFNVSEIEAAKLQQTTKPALSKRQEQINKHIAKRAEKKAIEEGRVISQKQEVKSAEAAGREAFDLDAEGYIKEAAKVGITGNKKALSTIETFKALKNIPKDMSSELKKEYIKTHVNSLFKQVRNQTGVGFIIGSIESFFKETYGVKMPPAAKYPIYASSGLPISRGGSKPFIPVGMALADSMFNAWAVSRAKDRMVGLKGSNRQIEFNKLKKNKARTAKERKEISSYKG